MANGVKSKEINGFLHHCALFFVMTASIFITGYAGEEILLGVVKALCGSDLVLSSTNIVRN